MNYAELAKRNGIKLELSTFRDHWRKSLNRKMHYFKYPQTKNGYESAIEEFYLLKAGIDSNRDNIEVYNHHLTLFKSVIDYYDAFGTPRSESKLKQSINQFVELIQEQIKQPILPEKIRLKEFLDNNKTFDSEFNRIDQEQRIQIDGYSFKLSSDIGTSKYQLPDKWQDRIDRLTPTIQDKKPQTIQFWFDDYLKTMNKKYESNQITKTTKDDRGYALSNFKKFVDLQSHITTLGNGFLDEYDHSLQINKKLKKKSKNDYMKTAKMFVRYCKLHFECDLNECNLLDKHYKYIDPQGTGRTRQQKKKMLWTKEQFAKALLLPEPYRCYCLLFLNCGFRHIDLSYLQQGDIDHDNQRIIIQRQKLNKLDTAPVINYKLWNMTYESLNECRRTVGNLVFGSVHDSFKSWWKRNGLGIRLDYLRKTGSTIVAEYDRGLDDFYLGECCKNTAKIHYSFNDGEIMPILDRGLEYLGSKFGICDAPAKTVELTPEIIAGLKKMGIAV